MINFQQALAAGKVRSIGCWDETELEEKLENAHVYSRGCREVPIGTSVPTPYWVPYVIPTETRTQYFAFIYDRRVSQKALCPVVERRRSAG